MSWSLHRWTWVLDAPLFVGMSPAGSLNRCRLYVPARAIWGAVTAALAQGQGNGFPDYQDLGTQLRDGVRFTYLFPAEHDGRTWRAWLPSYEREGGLVWRREDRADARHDLGDRVMRTRVLGTRPATAVDPSSDTAAEGSLRETECMNTRWRESDGSAGSLMALVGYLFAKEGAPDLTEVDALSVGGDARYGLGRLRRVELTEATAVFGYAATVDAVAEPLVESDRLLAHGEISNASSISPRGHQEALSGWDYGTRGVWYLARAVWTPGTILGTPCCWRVKPAGFWCPLQREGEN